MAENTPGSGQELSPTAKLLATFVEMIPSQDINHRHHPIDGEDRIQRDLCNLREAQRAADEGELASCAARIASITSGEYVTHALSQCAQTFARAGDMQSAEQLAGKITHNGRREQIQDLLPVRKEQGEHDRDPAVVERRHREALLY